MKRSKTAITPKDVNEAFAHESAYAAQQSVYLSSEGPDAVKFAFQKIVEVNPQRVLEVGCGLGELAESVVKKLGAQVVAIDISPRMVELTRQRGVAAEVGNVEHLNFRNGEFDCVVANWVLHYLDRPRSAIKEIARVLRPGGWLVAATPGETHLGEIWQLLFGDPHLEVSFSRENGRKLLRPYFRLVRSYDIEGLVFFRNYREVKQFIARHIRGAEVAKQLPRFRGPLQATRRTTIFVAER